MASSIRFISQSPREAEEDDFFPALFAETYPLPATTPVSHRNVSQVPAQNDRATWIAAQKERVA